MCVRYVRVFQVVVIGVLSLLSSVARADPAEEFARANKSLSVENMMDGLVVMRKLAVQNYAPAQAVLGEFLDWSEEDEEAVGWYMLAANQGNPAGEFGLGNMYLKGEGIKRDLEKALYWIKRASEKDYPNAVAKMASAYRLGPEKGGLPVAIDLELAKTLEEKVKANVEADRKAMDAVVDKNNRKLFEDLIIKEKKAKGVIDPVLDEKDKRAIEEVMAKDKKDKEALKAQEIK